MNLPHPPFNLSPTTEMKGEDEQETKELFEMLNIANDYLRSFDWCSEVERTFIGIGIGKVIAVFLFGLKKKKDVDDWLWVVVGDVPSAYLVLDEASDAVSALKVYCRVMEDWVIAVKTKSDLSKVFPVNVPADAKYAEMLQKRIDFIREKIIPEFS